MQRKEAILKLIKQRKEVTVNDILKVVQGSKVTILRDIDKLISEGSVIKTGKARATLYTPAIDLDEYFSQEQDARKLKNKSFNFNVWDELENIFTEAELGELSKTNNRFQEKYKELPPTLLRKEIERITIEFSWKSSKIEGNTYTLLDTELLIKENIEAVGKKKEETIMILNHKNALNYIFSEPEYFKTITVKKIQELHQILLKDLNVPSDFRFRAVGITGTNYHPLDVRSQIHEEIEKLCGLINNTKNPFAKALLAVLMISYIQPFEDGNKRTARILGNALLHAFDYCPLSYRSVDEVTYKKAMLLFYEQNNWFHFKKLFVQQFTEAVEKYF